MVEDFILHYVVEKVTGLDDTTIFLKAIKYYSRRGRK